MDGGGIELRGLELKGLGLRGLGLSATVLNDGIKSTQSISLFRKILQGLYIK
jgi:hypothetical protein